MPRPSLLQVAVVLLLGMVGLIAVSAAYRARTHLAVPPQQPPVAVPNPTPGTPQQLAPQPAAPPVAAARKKGLSFSVVHVRHGFRLPLRSKPGGHVLARAWWVTEYGSTATLAVAATRGRWLGLTSSDVPNGKLGWVRADDPALDLRLTRVSLLIDLSRRTLEVRDGQHVVRRARVGIGRRGSVTPTGRFSITDELRGSTFGPYYGCCILALSGHQTHPPAGWLGGDRLAIHGTNAPGSIGVRSSAGCLHADAEDLRVLMRRVPLGTPVFIQA
ncbi:MAG: hypothetical protein QOC95_2203 [Thermoleophilaceae bacterium]|nr:hypothetical protein [Thermoleophilaceae bacterium]